MKKISFLLIALFSGIVVFAQGKSAAAIVQQLTLEEKVNLVVGMGMNLPGMNMSSGTGVGQISDGVPGAAGSTYAIGRLNLPNTIVSDGPAGLRIDPKRKDVSGSQHECSSQYGTRRNQRPPLFYGRCIVIQKRNCK